MGFQVAPVNATLDTLKAIAAELAEEERWALFREYAATVRRIEGRHLSHFMSLGAPQGFWNNTGAPGVGSIRRLQDGCFEFAENGRSVAVLPVYDSATPAWSPLEHRFDGLLDLLAFDPTQPERWWLRRGQALLLGSIYVGLALEADSALPIYANPMSWIKANAEGVVVLDWEAAPSLLLDASEFLAEDVALGDRLQAALAPSIMVMDAT